MSDNEAGAVAKFSAKPPRAPSEFMFVPHAVVHVAGVLDRSWDRVISDDTEPLINDAIEKLYCSIIDGDIKVYQRLKSGSAFLPLSQNTFIREDLPESIFREGLFVESLASPTVTTINSGRALSSPGLRVEMHYYLFVDRAGLEKAYPLAPPVHAPAGVDPSDLSDYMRLALYVASLGYGSRFTGLKKEIQRKLVEHAPQFNLGGGLLTPTTEEGLATILRNIDAQGGRAGPLRKKDTG